MAVWVSGLKAGFSLAWPMIRGQMTDQKSNRRACLCCGYLTLGPTQPGVYELCPVCGWEDTDPEFNGWALSNEVTLRDAQRNFIEA